MLLAGGKFTFRTDTATTASGDAVGVVLVHGDSIARFSPVKWPNIDTKDTFGTRIAAPGDAVGVVLVHGDPHRQHVHLLCAHLHAHPLRRAHPPRPLHRPRQL